MKKYAKPIIVGCITALVSRILGYDLLDPQFYLILILQLLSFKIGYNMSKTYAPNNKIISNNQETPFPNSDFSKDKLIILSELRDLGILSEDEYMQKKKQILDKF